MRHVANKMNHKKGITESYHIVSIDLYVLHRFDRGPVAALDDETW